METPWKPLGNPFNLQRRPLACVHMGPYCLSLAIARDTNLQSQRFLCGLARVCPFYCFFINKQCLIPTFCPGLPFSVQDEMFGIKDSQAAGVRLNALHVQECLCTGLVLSRFGILMCALMSSYSFWSSLDRPVHGCFLVPFCMVDDRRPATNDQRPTTNDAPRPPPRARGSPPAVLDRTRNLKK